MADRSITSADAEFFISSADFALVSTKIEGFTADAAFAMEGVDIAETVLGVDGKLSAGWIPQSYPQVITLSPDSPSRKVFDAIVAFQNTGRTVVRINGIITLNGNKYSHNLRRGVLKNYKPMPDGQRILQPMPFTIEWEAVQPIPLS